MTTPPVKHAYLLRIKEDINSPFLDIHHLDETLVFTSRIAAYKYMCDFLDEPLRKQRITNVYELGLEIPQPAFNTLEYALSENVEYVIQHGPEDNSGPYFLTLSIKKYTLNNRYHTE